MFRKTSVLTAYALFGCLLAAQASFAAEAVNQLIPDHEDYINVRVQDTVGNGEALLCTVFGMDAVRFEIEFMGKTLDLRAQSAPDHKGGVWIQVLLPIPIDHPGGQEKLVCSGFNFYNTQKRTSTLMINVVPKAYPEQRLTVEQRYVTPAPELAERIARESARTRQALSSFGPISHLEFPLQRPVPGIVTSEYGLRRVLNGSPRSPHLGLDLRGAEGTPVAAMSAGTVLLADEFYYAGNNVIIDHGWGVLTSYMHLSEIKVQTGQKIEQGEVIGLVGSTGRVTGPHLHFGLSVGGVSVNPLPLLDPAFDPPRVRNQSE